MEVKTVAGRKTDYGDDEIYMIKTDGWEAVTNDQILDMVKFIFKNENNIYPKELGYKGSDMFMHLIKQAHQTQ